VAKRSSAVGLGAALAALRFVGTIAQAVPLNLVGRIAGTARSPWRCWQGTVPTAHWGGEQAMGTNALWVRSVVIIFSLWGLRPVREEDRLVVIVLVTIAVLSAACFTVAFFLH
jgi:hypothetical protein